MARVDCPQPVAVIMLTHVKPHMNTLSQFSVAVSCNLSNFLGNSTT
jgi:hypothetical protein